MALRLPMKQPARRPTQLDRQCARIHALDAPHVAGEIDSHGTSRIVVRLASQLDDAAAGEDRTAPVLEREYTSQYGSKQAIDSALARSAGG